MPQPTPEVQQAQANLKAAQQQLQAATFAQWEVQGVSRNFQIQNFALGAMIGSVPAIFTLSLWEDHLIQQHWAAYIQQNPRFSGMPAPGHITDAKTLPFLLASFGILLTVIKQNQILKSYPRTRRTVAFATGLGVLAGIAFSYFMSLPILNHV